MPPQVITVRNASKVAAALANEKCQRILDYLGKHEDATESQLAKELSLALSTVHYNMKILADAKLVLSDEYTYSVKGKEVTHYKLNKNPIVIVQEEQQIDMLKALVPAAVLAAGIGVAYQLLRKAPEQAMAAKESITMVAEDSARTMAADAAMQAPIVPPNMLPWFIAGVITTVVLSVLFFALQKWMHNRDE